MILIDAADWLAPVEEIEGLLPVVTMLPVSVAVAAPAVTGPATRPSTPAAATKAPATVPNVRRRPFIPLNGPPLVSPRALELELQLSGEIPMAGASDGQLSSPRLLATAAI